MPDMTPTKIGHKTFVKHAIANRVDTTGNTYKIAVTDPSNVFILVQPSSLSTGTFQVRVSASTDPFTSKGLGDYVVSSTNAAAPLNPVRMPVLIGPFESARFLDVSTGGRTLKVRVASTSGTADDFGPLAANSVMMMSFEVFPAT